MMITRSLYFLCIPVSAADAAAANPRGIKTLFGNGVITFFIKGNPVLVMDQVICQKSSWLYHLI